MIKLVVASCLASVALGQFVEPEKAKILKEQRFNAGDGRFGAAYAQEDGTVYREETTADGERIGQYSYIDTNGKTVTVKYTAGRDGFRILEGDHVPAGADGQNSAQASQQQAVQQPRQSQQFVQPRVAVDYDYEYYDGATPAQETRAQSFAPAPVQNFAPVQPAQRAFVPAQPVARAQQPASTNPFINPHDPTHRNFQFNVNGANFGGQSASAPARQPALQKFQQPARQQFQQPSQSAVPACANCAGVNPFINPFDASHRNPAAFAPAPTAAPRQQFQQHFAPQQFAAPARQQFATPAPRNFFPPGNLQLNRFENGFNFDFTSQ